MYAIISLQVICAIYNNTKTVNNEKQMIHYLDFLVRCFVLCAIKSSAKKNMKRMNILKNTNIKK